MYPQNFTDAILSYYIYLVKRDYERKKSNRRRRIDVHISEICQTDKYNFILFVCSVSSTHRSLILSVWEKSKCVSLGKDFITSSHHVISMIEVKFSQFVK